MKVLHILNTSSYSGAENVVCQIIEMFRTDDDIDMVYVSPKGEIEDILKCRGINYYPIDRLSYSELKRVVDDTNPDIIHAHDFRASLLATLCRTKRIISHLHKNDPKLKKISIKSLLYFFFMHKFEKILVVSDSVKNEYILSRPYLSKFVCVGNPIDMNKIVTMSEEIYYEETYDIGFVGRLEEPKNPILFIQIVAELVKLNANINACIIGDGTLRREMEEMIKNLNISRNVTLKGFMQNPYAIMKNMRVLCVTSLWEGFGLSAVEALALEKPVVCSGVGGLSDIIDNSCGKICLTLEDYVNEINYLLNDKEYYLKKKNGARDRGLSYDNIESYKKKIRFIYYEKG